MKTFFQRKLMVFLLLLFSIFHLIFTKSLWQPLPLLVRFRDIGFKERTTFPPKWSLILTFSFYWCVENSFWSRGCYGYWPRCRATKKNFISNISGDVPLHQRPKWGKGDISANASRVKAVAQRNWDSRITFEVLSHENLSHWIWSFNNLYS